MNYTGMKCLVRTNQAGVFYGTIKEYDKTAREVTVAGCRRIWKWSGAASLSQMAVEGVKDPEGCRFTMTVEEMCVMEVIEIIPCTDKAQEIIESVKEWKA